MGTHGLRHALVGSATGIRTQPKARRIEVTVHLNGVIFYGRRHFHRVRVTCRATASR